jgi:transcriptional regulator with XRE-family HTH domain
VLDGPLDYVHALTIGITDVERKCIACYRRRLLESGMLKGKELGDAIRAALKLKGVTQNDVAEEFGIKQPSVSEWLRFGRVDKGHVNHLVTYFSDVVGPAHWGLGDVLSVETITSSVDEPVRKRDSSLSSREISAIYDNLQEAERERLTQLMVVAGLVPGAHLEVRWKTNAAQQTPGKMYGDQAGPTPDESPQLKVVTAKQRGHKK